MVFMESTNLRCIILRNWHGTGLMKLLSESMQQLSKASTGKVWEGWSSQQLLLNQT